MAKMTIKQARQIADKKGITIRGNNTPHDLVYWHELTPREQKELDYLDTDARREDAIFFRYRGNVYDLGEFPRVESYAPDYLQAFDAFSSDTFFSGVGIILTDDNERVLVYTLYS